MPSLISQLPGCRPSVGGAGILRRSTDACSDDEKDIHLLMKEILLASLLGLATTSSAMIEVAVGLYVPISKRLLGCILAFASGGLISALAIELAFNGAVQLHHLGFSVGAAWLLVGSGFAIGAIIYSVLSLSQAKWCCRPRPTRFREFIQKRREHDAKELIELLSRCDLLRPPQEIEIILPSVRTRRLAAGQVLFNAGDPGDILYIVARGEIEILEANGSNGVPPDQPIASLREGEAFGEMALSVTVHAPRRHGLRVTSCSRLTGRTSSGWSPRIRS